MFPDNGRILDSRRWLWSTWVPPTLLLSNLSPGTGSVAPTHTVSASCIWRCCVSHPASFKSPYTMMLSATTSGLTLAVWFRLFLLSTPSLPTQEVTCPHFCSSRIWVNTRGCWVKGCSLFLVLLWGLSSIPTGHGLPALIAFAQGQMWNSHISGTAFVEKGNAWNPWQMPQKPALCRRQRANT